MSMFCCLGQGVKSVACATDSLGRLVVQHLFLFSSAFDPFLSIFFVFRILCALLAPSRVVDSGHALCCPCSALGCSVAPRNGWHSIG